MLTNRLRNILIGMQEGLTGYMAVIQSDHAYVHKSIAYSIALDLGTLTGAYYIALETPTVADGKEIHFRPSQLNISSTDDSVSFQLLEGITSYTGGTTYTPFNRNRDSVQTSLSTVKYGVTPTIGSPTSLIELKVGTTGGFFSSGGGTASGGTDEIILKKETTYLMVFTPAGNTDVAVNSFWYEENP